MGSFVRYGDGDGRRHLLVIERDVLGDQNIVHWIKGWVRAGGRMQVADWPSMTSACGKLTARMISSDGPIERVTCLDCVAAFAADKLERSAVGG